MSVLRFTLIASVLLVLLGIHEGFYNYHFKKGRAALAAGNTNEAVRRLEKSKNLFFERDLANYLAAAYKTWRQKEIQLLQKMAQITVDAALLDRLGEIYFEDKKYAEAENLLLRALDLDPANRLRYYYFFLETQRKQGKRMPPEMRQKIKNLLVEYAAILRTNSHMTILTDNPLYAGKLYDFFGMKKEREQLDKIWFEELIKFSTKYGTIPKPIL